MSNAAKAILKEPASTYKDKARAFWSERYGREISETEVDEIHCNLTGFFSLLQEWDKNPVDSALPNEVGSA